MKSLTATLVEIQLKKENSKIAFGRQSLGAQTGIPVSQTAWIRHCSRPKFNDNRMPNKKA